MRSISVFALVLTVSTPLASAQFHLEDSLRGGTMGNASGGSFGPEGWTVTGAEDRIWYALPRLASGYVEFTVSNITTANLVLPDHEIFAMYEAGYGISEPIHYAPEFRVNHYKILMRVYGEAKRLGAVKLMWGMCPSGAPGHSDCGCGSFFSEPFENPPPWTGAPVRVRIEWGGGRTRMLLDGVELLSIDWRGSGLAFGPQELHMMLGSPRNDGGLSAMPLGAVLSDLVVDGTEGPLATCPGVVMPDAGVPGDAGGCDGSGLAIADATAASWETGVFPDANDLTVEGDGSTPNAVVYLRFPRVEGAARRATLTLQTTSSGSAAGGSGVICRVDGGVWDEATLTWATRPTVSAACSGGARRVSPSEAVSWDVTPLITASGEPSLAIVSTDADGAHYLSREAGGCALGPRLDVEGAPPVGTDAGSTPPRGDDAGRAPARMSVEGCTCTSAGSPAIDALAIAMLALVWMWRRARRGGSSRAARA
jgi:hypothetical protein